MAGGEQVRHLLPEHFRNGRVDVALVGVGGSGTQMISALARIHVSLLALGHSSGLKVTAYDSDNVSEANVGRQMFSMSDVGQNKAAVMVNRINAFFGTDWTARPQKFDSDRTPSVDLVVTCVDTAAARVSIGDKMAGKRGYWLDLGNEAHTGQVVLGNFNQTKSKVACDKERIPNVLDLFKSLRKRGVETNTPSCSLAGALIHQDLFVNQMVATWASNLLWKWFRQGYIEEHGYFINLAGSVTSLPVCANSWRRLGYAAELPPLRKIKKFIKRARGMLDYHTVKLECGHIAHCKGEKRARCTDCQNDQAHHDSRTETK